MYAPVKRISRSSGAKRFRGGTFSINISSHPGRRRVRYVNFRVNNLPHQLAVGLLRDGPLVEVFKENSADR
jgi:hypothetical protein